jgi:hypothetical protein
MAKKTLLECFEFLLELCCLPSNVQVGHSFCIAFSVPHALQPCVSFRIVLCLLLLGRRSRCLLATVAFSVLRLVRPFGWLHTVAVIARAAAAVLLLRLVCNWSCCRWRHFMSIRVRSICAIEHGRDNHERSWWLDYFNCETAKQLLQLILQWPMPLTDDLPLLRIFHCICP